MSKFNIIVPKPNRVIVKHAHNNSELNGSKDPMNSKFLILIDQSSDGLPIIVDQMYQNSFI